MPPLIEPSNHESCWKADAERCLSAAKSISASEASWWVNVLDGLSGAVPEDQAMTEGSLDGRVELVIKLYDRHEGKIDSVVVEFIARWCGLDNQFQQGISPRSGTVRLPSDACVQFLIHKAAEARVDFGRGLGDLANVQGSDLKLGGMAGWFLWTRVIRLADIVDPKAFGEYGTNLSLISPQHHRDFRRLEYWLMTFGLESGLGALSDTDGGRFPSLILDEVVHLLRTEPVERLGPFSLGLLKVVNHARLDPHSAWGKILSWEAAAKFLVTVLDILEKNRDAAEADKTLRLATWRLALTVMNIQPDLMPAEQKKSLAAQCAECWGRFRSRLREKPSAAEVDTRGEELWIAAWTLASLSSPWQALKATLLAFRAMPEPAVADDLRYWNEKNMVDTPAVWEMFGRLPSELLHTWLGIEQKQDAYLESFRAKFMEFCLQRLESRDNVCKAPEALRDEDMVEPNADWRECMIRAARELKINPGRRGRHTLHWASVHDPSPRVRKAALAAYREMNSRVTLEDGRSPRATIFAAYWWLRQAHLLSLGRVIDPDGAQRTRIKELRRTKEVEHSWRLEQEKLSV